VREARVFTSALIGAAASERATAAYVRAHDALDLGPHTAFDVRMLAVARAGPLGARAADAYARFFAKGGVLRRKLVVLAAVLESTAPHDAAFAPIGASPAGVAVRLALTGLGFAGALALGLLVLGPLHALAAVTGRA